ncbi:uncharacterized protein BYT42DRAFT_614794 [Radiomyces spectabilis]|uniref:uncharacterized protein n=1 Tax=Radiomyces spectabilis TaxID=64574 RepID=UPI00221FCA9F|nr:uncharacterized protein BYT42DRAFT_614794 [Radiomyces spectabilis]KAI8376006.1 hypothetical protein BYT42DRAFT_614794 [Radiomyces spectabilis]
MKPLSVTHVDNKVTECRRHGASLDDLDIRRTLPLQDLHSDAKLEARRHSHSAFKFKTITSITRHTISFNSDNKENIPPWLQEPSTLSPREPEPSYRTKSSIPVKDKCKSKLSMRSNTLRRLSNRQSTTKSTLYKSISTSPAATTTTPFKKLSTCLGPLPSSSSAENTAGSEITSSDAKVAEVADENQTRRLMTVHSKQIKTTIHQYAAKPTPQTSLNTKHISKAKRGVYCPTLTPPPRSPSSNSLVSHKSLTDMTTARSKRCKLSDASNRRF